MKVKNANGTIMESSDAFVIQTWKEAGFREVSETAEAEAETAEAEAVTKSKRSRKKQ